MNAQVMTQNFQGASAPTSPHDLAPLFDCEGSKIELVAAVPGNFKDKEKSYYDSIEDVLKSHLTEKRNHYFVGSVRPQAEREYENNRSERAKVKDITTKHHITLDVDCKDFIPGFLSQDATKKEQIIKATFLKSRPTLVKILGTPHLVIDTGNGFQASYRLKKGFTINGDAEAKKAFKLNYCSLIETLEKSSGEISFDTAFANPAQLARVPGTWNTKKETARRKGLFLEFNPVNDSSLLDFEAFTPPPEERNWNPHKVFNFDGSGDFKDRVKASLTLSDVLDHFGYSKQGSISGPDSKGEICLSSPLTGLNHGDKNPSFFFNESKKVFYCWSTSQGGDLLRLIELLKPCDFTEALEIGSNITGVSRAPKHQDSAKKGCESPMLKYDTYVEKLFKPHLPEHKRDRLSGALKYLDKGNRTWVDVRNYIPVLRSFADDIEGISERPVQYHLLRYEQGLPRELLIDIPAWDGNDRIQAIADCIAFTEFSKAEGGEIIKHWGSTVFKKVDDPVMNQNRVLIFDGGQGKGKDTLINTLIGGFGVYANNFTIGSKVEDTFDKMTSHLVLNMPETDQLSRKDQAMVKNIINSPGEVYRSAYGKANRPRVFFSSFIGSANRSNFFTDYTGNRRYIVLGIDDIIWGYPGVKGSRGWEKHQRQIIAQFHALYKSGFTLPENIEIKINGIMDRLTPIDPRDTFSDQLLEGFKKFYWKAQEDEITGGGSPYTRTDSDGFLIKASHPGLAEAIKNVSESTGIKCSTLRRSIKNDLPGVCFKNSNGNWYWLKA